MTHEEQIDRFQCWVSDHAAVLHHVANGFAAGADRHDLMQELLLALWRAVPAFQAAARDSTFVYRVAHNAALTWKRSQRNYRKRVDQYEVMVAALPAGASPAASREGEAVTLLYAAIRQLPPVDRSLILLHLDGVAYADMAAIHGLSPSNVGVRLNRLKQKLVKSLQGIAHELR